MHSISLFCPCFNGGSHEQIKPCRHDYGGLTAVLSEKRNYFSCLCFVVWASLSCRRRILFLSVLCGLALCFFFLSPDWILGVVVIQSGCPGVCFRREINESCSLASFLIIFLWFSSSCDHSKGKMLMRLSIATTYGIWFYHDDHSLRISKLLFRNFEQLERK